MVRRRLCRAVGAFYCLHLIQQGNGFALQPQGATMENNKPTPAYWHVFRAANQLEENGLSTADNRYNRRRDDLTRQTGKILRQWGDKWAGEREMQTLLNKPELLHEIEESIIALAPFCDWLDSLTTTQEGMEPITLVDVCAGKGIFSMLASYVLQGQTSMVKQIVMLDKANMNWNHIRTANDDAERDDRPPIITWSKCNLHEIDEVVGRLNNLDTPLALVGLHLCMPLEIRVKFYKAVIVNTLLWGCETWGMTARHKHMSAFRRGEKKDVESNPPWCFQYIGCCHLSICVPSPMLPTTGSSKTKVVHKRK